MTSRTVFFNWLLAGSAVLLLVCPASALQFSHAFAPGGSLGLTNETYSIDDIKGQALNGQAVGAGYSIDFGALSEWRKDVVVAEGVPYGTVPLFISRFGNDIKISWEAKYIQPQIFIKTGAGEGIYSDSTDGWGNAKDLDVSLALQLDMSHYSSATEPYILHIAEAGQAATVKEAYYKGVQAVISRDQLSPDPTYTGKTIFATAWAVGKVSVTLTLDWNMISPTLSSDSLNGTLGASFIDGDELYKWDNSSTQALSKVAVFNGGTASWQLVNAATWTNMTNGEGYGLNILNLPPSTTSRVVTMIGSVRKEGFAGTIRKDWNKVGNSFPYATTLNNGSGLTAGKSKSGDMFYTWDQSLPGLKKVSEFKGTAWDPDYVLRPGIGYGYNYMGEPGDPLVWNVNKQ